MRNLNKKKRKIMRCKRIKSLILQLTSNQIQNKTMTTASTTKKCMKTPTKSRSSRNSLTFKLNWLS